MSVSTPRARRAAARHARVSLERGGTQPERDRLWRESQWARCARRSSFGATSALVAK